MENIMKQIRELKDEIDNLKTDLKQLRGLEKEARLILDAVIEEHSGDYASCMSSKAYVKALAMHAGIRLRLKVLESVIDSKEKCLRELRRKTYHVEGECQYCLLDLNDIAGVIDKDGFIRGIKF